MDKIKRHQVSLHLVFLSFKKHPEKLVLRFSDYCLGFYTEIYFGLKSVDFPLQFHILKHLRSYSMSCRLRAR